VTRHGSIGERVLPCAILDVRHEELSRTSSKANRAVRLSHWAAALRQDVRQARPPRTMRARAAARPRRARGVAPGTNHCQHSWHCRGTVRPCRGGKGALLAGCGHQSFRSRLCHHLLALLDAAFRRFGRLAISFSIPGRINGFAPFLFCKLAPFQATYAVSACLFLTAVQLTCRCVFSRLCFSPERITSRFDIDGMSSLSSG